VILQVWGSAAVLVAASVLIGDAIGLLGARCRAAGPAVGLALLILIADVAIKLPGRAVTAAVACAVVTVAAAVLVVIRRLRDRPAVRGLAVALITMVVAAFGAAVPFIANGHVGLPGVGLDNDTANHLVWAEALQSPVAAARYGGLPNGYPLGPHSLADALSTGLGARLDLAFTGLLIGTVIITAVVASAAFRGDAAWKRVVTGVLAALFYLVAAYYAEGAFKETLLGLFLLAMVLHLEEVRAEWVVGSKQAWRTLLPVSVLVAGGFYVYSYPAAAWLGLTLVIWAVAEVLARPKWLRRWRALVIDIAPAAAIALGVLVLLLLPNVGRIANFAGTIGTSPSGTGAITSSNQGNLAGPLSPYEALGIWRSPDFRVAPVDRFTAGQLAAFALAVLALGMARSIYRREFVLPAAVAACAIVYWRASHGESSYVTAKALVIAGPVVAVAGLRGLLRWVVPPLPRLFVLAQLAVAVAFVFFAASSSYAALRNEPVWPPESTSELLSLAKLIPDQPILFLGDSDYAPWLFDDADMSALAEFTVSHELAVPRATKPFVYGAALDFDSVDPHSLNKFRWVVTTNTTDASQPPAAFRLVRQLPMYQLWERVGLVGSRLEIDASGAPGAILNCGNRALRALSRRRGVAAVMTEPVTVPVSAMRPGGSQDVTLRLPRGRWDLSLQYVSPVDVSLRVGSQRWQMPAYLDRPGPLFAVGSVTSDGQPMALKIQADRPSPLTGADLVASTTAVVATRSPNTRTLLPLNRSCGRYVDWYRLLPGSGSTR
jgi:hypothetical protein